VEIHLSPLKNWSELDLLKIKKGESTAI